MVGVSLGASMSYASQKEGAYSLDYTGQGLNKFEWKQLQAQQELLKSQQALIDHLKKEIEDLDHLRKEIEDLKVIAVAVLSAPGFDVETGQWATPAGGALQDSSGSVADSEDTSKQQQSKSVRKSIMQRFLGLGSSHAEDDHE